MLFKEILISVDEHESRVAVMEDGRLMEIYISREDRQAGSIYKGRVCNVLPGMQASFVDIGLEKNAFMCMDDAVTALAQDVEVDELRKLSIKDILKVNQECLVQVTKESIGGKGARVTTNITLPGRFLVLMPRMPYIGVSRRIESEEERDRLRKLVSRIRPENVGIIVRTAAEDRDEHAIKHDLDMLLKLWERIQQDTARRRAPVLIHQELALVNRIIRDLFTVEVDKLVIDSPTEHEKILELLDIISPTLKKRVFLYTEKKPLFDAYGVEKEVERALRRKVWLESGGHIVIDKTEALTVIDVNTGKFVGHKSLADTVLKTNLEAIDEIVRQLRLRDIGGIVIIDFIDMDDPKHRKKVLRAMEDAMKRDRTKTNILGITELGLLQLTRKRVSKDLDDYMREDCPICGGKGRVFSLETMRIRGEREIRGAAMEDRHEAMLVRVNPRLGLALLGWEGEGVERLEKQTGKQIYFRVDRELHPEKVDLYCQSVKRIREKVVVLVTGQDIEVQIQEASPHNIQNGIAIFSDNMVEVLSAGNRIGERVHVVITRASNSYAQATLCD